MNITLPTYVNHPDSIEQTAPFWMTFKQLSAEEQRDFIAWADDHYEEFKEKGYNPLYHPVVNRRWHETAQDEADYRRAMNEEADGLMFLPDEGDFTQDELPDV